MKIETKATETTRINTGMLTRVTDAIHAREESLFAAGVAIVRFEAVWSVEHESDGGEWPGWDLTIETFGRSYAPDVPTAKGVYSVPDGGESAGGDG